MYIWLLIGLVWVVGFGIFIAEMYNEAPKHGARITIRHYLIAAIWPLWCIWYGAVLLKDKFK